MHSVRLLISALLFSAMASAATPAGITEAAARVEKQTANLPLAVRADFRLSAAEALHERYPELSRKFLTMTLDELRAGKDLDIDITVLRELAALDPAGAVSLLPAMKRGSEQSLLMALGMANHTDEAVALFRKGLAHQPVHPAAGSALLARLAKDKPAEATRLFNDIVAAVNFDSLEPADAYGLINCAVAVGRVSPEVAASALERLAKTVAAPEYGQNAKSGVTGTFQLKNGPVVTANSRDTLLLLSGARLSTLSPEKFNAMKATFSKWELSPPVTVKGISITGPDAPVRTTSAEAAPIQQDMGKMRGLATDAERAKLVIDLAGRIQAIPDPAVRLSLIRGLANLSTEGDLGKPALTAVATTLARALHDGGGNGSAYVELAKLVRYEGVPAPAADPGFAAADALLTLRDQIHQETGFTLTALDGKTYSLAGLRGHVVLLNFPQGNAGYGDVVQEIRQQRAGGARGVGRGTRDGREFHRQAEVYVPDSA